MDVDESYGELLSALADAQQAARQLQQRLVAETNCRQRDHATAMEQALDKMRHDLMVAPAISKARARRIIRELETLRLRCIGELHPLRISVERSLIFAERIVR